MATEVTVVDTGDSDEAEMAANIAVEAAVSSVEASEVATQATTQAEASSAVSEESADVSVAAAGISTVAAVKSEKTLEGLYDLVHSLPERLAPLFQQQQSATPAVPTDAAPSTVGTADETPAVESKPKSKVDVKPDSKPDNAHWFYKKRSQRK